MNSRRPLMVVAIVFMALGIAAGAWRMKVEPPKATAANSLFSLKLPGPDGQIHPLAQWRGKILVVNFWASWCGPCVKEMPELSALQDSLGGQRIQVIGIGIDSAANIAAFAARHQITYPLYAAGNDGIQLSRDFGNQMGVLPFTAMLGSDGTIRKTYTGIKTDEIRRDLAAL